MPKIKINDINMYYEMHGSGEPIVFISGFSCDHTVWEEVAKKLQNNYQIILFDNRGAGQSDAPDQAYSIKQMSDDLALLCAKLNIKEAYFVGNSMGGFILQTLAFHNPNLVKKAIISNSATNIHTCFHFYVDAQRELLLAGAPLKSLIKASCCWTFSYRFLSDPKVFDELINWSLSDPHPFTLRGYAGQYAALDSFDSRAWVNKITKPVLVIGGDQDLIFREPVIRNLAESISGAKYYCFNQCGHLPSIEYPEEFVNLVQSFIAS